MTLLGKNRTSLPVQVSDFFNTGTMFPSVFDWQRDLFNFGKENFMLPDANIIENDKDFKIELAAPGLEKNDFKVEVDNGVLTVSAEKREESNEEKKNYRRREFSYQSFSRSFSLPENSLSDKIDAKYDNGILHLTLPKKEVSIKKPTEIKVS